MDSIAIAQLGELLAGKKKIFIVTHKNPDGDAIGSAVGWGRFLMKMGHDVTMAVPNEFPDFLNWIESSSEVLLWTVNADKIRETLSAAEIIFCLDFNSLHRIDEIGELIALAKGKKVLIDHHQQPDTFPDITFSDVTACSTSQMVFEVIEALGKKELIDAGAAGAMYCGIMTDTGSFKFPSTTATTHRVVGELIEAGADNAKIHQLVYDTQSLDRLHLIGHCLNTMEVLPAYKTAIIKVAKKDHHTFNIQRGDSEGIVNYPLSVKDIHMSVFLREDKDMVKISFRSKGSVDVNVIARKHFSGGGHINAAGGVSMEGLDKAVQKLKAILPEYAQELNK
ncbi:MAG: DHH family phosphoesterase [Flavobacteriales bacterium]